MSPRSCLTLLVCALIVPGAAYVVQSPDERKAWNAPVPPFRVIGNVHYVGAAGVSSFLITTPEGSILLDGGLPETAPQIAANVAALGFSVTDIKVLLNSHAHFDHSGGLAEMKRLSGASVVASEGDAPALRAGGPGAPPVAVDRVVQDGGTVELGGTRMTAHVTAGHTRGCTTWSTTAADNGRNYRVLFHCSTSVVDRLVDNRAYPRIVADYEESFRRLRAMEADVFLGPHPVFFDMAAKRAKMRDATTNPFIDPGELGRFVESSERQFRARLAEESGRRK